MTFDLQTLGVRLQYGQVGQSWELNKEIGHIITLYFVAYVL
jgi:hypothetical protein